MGRMWMWMGWLLLRLWLECLLQHHSLLHRLCPRCSARHRSGPTVDAGQQRADPGGQVCTDPAEPCHAERAGHVAVECPGSTDASHTGASRACIAENQWNTHS